MRGEPICLAAVKAKHLEAFFPKGLASALELGFILTAERAAADLDAKQSDPEQEEGPAQDRAQVPDAE